MDTVPLLEVPQQQHRVRVLVNDETGEAKTIAPFFIPSRPCRFTLMVPHDKVFIECTYEWSDLNGTVSAVFTTSPPWWFFSMHPDYAQPGIILAQRRNLAQACLRALNDHFAIMAIFPLFSTDPPVKAELWD